MANALRQIRERRGWSVGHLAKKLHMSKMRLSRLERSKTRLPLDLVKRLADALECHWLDILEGMIELPPDEIVLLKDYMKLNANNKSALRAAAHAFAAEQHDEPPAPEQSTGNPPGKGRAKAA